MIKTQLLQFRQRIFLGKLYSQELGRVKEQPLNEAVERWIVPREYCLFYRHDFAAVPPKQRLTALRNYLGLLSPFAQFDYWVYWQGSESLIWLWDKSQLAKLQNEYFKNLVPDKLQNIPESALTPQNPTEPVFYQLDHGYLGQFWQDGLLLGDYWWSKEPSLESWQYFLKSMGASTMTELPKPQILAEVSQKLWPITVSWEESARKLEAPLLQLGMIGMVFFLLYFSIGSLRLQLTQWQLEDELIVAEEQGQLIVSLRESAYQQRASNQELINLQSQGQLALMLEFIEALPDTAGGIQRWIYGENKLEVLLDDALPNLADYVDSLESRPFFSRVTAEPASRNSQVVLKMTVINGGTSE